MKRSWKPKKRSDINPDARKIRGLWFRELFTSPRKEEADFVKKVLREHGIRYSSREGHSLASSATGWRYCIDVPASSLNRAAKIIDEKLSERGW